MPTVATGFGEQPGGNLLPLGIIDPILADQEIEVLPEKKRDGIIETQPKRRNSCD